MALSPPGPRGHWLLGSLPDVRRDMPQFLLDVAADYGGLVRLRVGPAVMYLVSDPDLILEAIARRPAEFRKSDRTRRSIGGHLGDGLITLEGGEHRRHRQLMQPAMHTRRIAGQAALIVDLAARRARSWPDGGEVDVLPEMADLTLRIVCGALFHVDDTEELTAAVHDFARSLGVSVRQPFPVPGWLPTSGNRMRRAAVRRVDALAYPLIQARRATGGDGGDLLSMLVSTGLSDVEVRDELMTMFFAGHETSASALTWAFYLLAEHPATAATVRTELSDVLDGRPPGFGDLPWLPLLGQVVKETLRMYPPAWLFDRTPLADLELGGHRVPRGANMLFSPWVVHRTAALWPEPDAFRPERFAGEPPPRGAYLPFGDGPRMCIGNRFAEAEIALVLATMLPLVELSRVDTRPARPEPGATLRPAGGLRMRVRRIAETRPGR